MDKDRREGKVFHNKEHGNRDIGILNPGKRIYYDPIRSDMGEPMVDRYLKAMLVSFIVVFTSLSGCFGSDDGPSDNDHKVDDDVTTPETTKQLDNEALSSMTSISEDGSEMVFKGFDLPDIEEEDVLSLGISENTPYGLLRKVTGIRTEGDQTTLTTKQATIEDAVEEGRIEYRENITIPEKLTYSVDGVSLWTEPTRSGGDGIIFQNVELYKGDPGSIILNGLLDMDFDLIFILDLEDFSITECSFGARTTFTGELNITSDGDMEFDTELEVSRIEFTPFIIPMGPIELVLVPVLSLVIGSEGTVSSGLCVTSRQDTILDVSVEHPGWQPTKDFTSNFEYSTPTLSNGTSVNCYAGPEMALLLWGVAGPYITA
ncbi:MAG: hypothetical protein U9R75_00615, partial [Candidatus Thermoplasmatota archaeon]|nr:hypothetical protein [Candidatus Thermoplasmatota archaeon]